MPKCLKVRIDLRMFISLCERKLYYHNPAIISPPCNPFQPVSTSPGSATVARAPTGIPSRGCWKSISRPGRSTRSCILFWTHVRLTNYSYDYNNNNNNYNNNSSFIWRLGSWVNATLNRWAFIWRSKSSRVGWDRLMGEGRSRRQELHIYYSDLLMLLQLRITN